jgi:hypothetical protein
MEFSVYAFLLFLMLLNIFYERESIKALFVH